MSLTEDVRKLMSPTDEDGKINPLYSDIYFKLSLERRYGKKVVDREYNRLKHRMVLDSWDDNKAEERSDRENKEEERSDKEEIEALKSRVRRLEKDVKWLKKVVRQLVNSDNSNNSK